MMLKVGPGFFARRSQLFAIIIVGAVPCGANVKQAAVVPYN
jgi:hypothetical protein